MRPRQPLIGLALAAVAGVLLADRCPVSAADALAAVGFTLVALLAWTRTESCLLFVAAGFFALHTLRYHGSEARMLADRLGPGPMVVSATGIVWNEPEKPKVWSRNTTCHFQLRVERLTVDHKGYAATALTEVRWAGAIPQYGDRVELLGSLQSLPPIRNEAQFDFPAYERRLGIYSEITARYASDCRVLGSGFGQPLQRFAYAAQHWICHCLELDLQDAPQVASLIESMILGMHGDTSEETKELFQRTGTMHLFAVSGLNVAMLAAIAWAVLKTLRVSRRAAILVIIPLIVLYAFITGLSASCVRATVMGALVFGGYLLDRRPLAFNGLAASALVILAWDTNQLFLAGFQYSFLLVAILIGCASRVTKWAEPWGQPDPFLPKPLWSWPQHVQAYCWTFLAGALSVSLTSWIGSLFFAVGYFHLFTPNSVLANILAVPISFVILALGVASLLVGWISPGVAILFNNANFGVTKALIWVVQFFAAAPGGYLYVANPRFESRPICEFTVLDTGGGGGAIHLRSGGADWLLDCGHGFGYDHVVQPFLRAQGVNRLDGLLLTHGKAARIGDALPAVDDFHPRCLVDSPLRDRSSTRRKIHAALAERGLPKRIVQRGDVINIAPGVRLTVLYPPAGLVKSSSDDKALVLRLEAAGRRILFTSDSGYATEQWLVENEPDLRADILVKGQHGKDLSGTPDFLLHVQPRVIVAAAPEISASPADYDDWAEAVKKQGIELFRQERTGAVHGAITSGSLMVKGFLNGQNLRLP